MASDKVNSAEFVNVAPELLVHCFVKSARAEDLSREEIVSLMEWCDFQREDLWDGLTLQEILNVYRVSAEWENFEAWAEEEGNVARFAWNRVVRERNHLVIHTEVEPDPTNSSSAPNAGAE